MKTVLVSVQFLSEKNVGEQLPEILSNVCVLC